VVIWWLRYVGFVLLPDDGFAGQEWRSAWHTGLGVRWELAATAVLGRREFRYPSLDDRCGNRVSIATVSTAVEFR